MWLKIFGFFLVFPVIPTVAALGYVWRNLGRRRAVAKEHRLQEYGEWLGGEAFVHLPD